jgi:hypothetical protein
MQQQAADALDALRSDPLAVILAVNEEGDRREPQPAPVGAGENFWQDGLGH